MHGSSLFISRAEKGTIIPIDHWVAHMLDRPREIKQNLEIK